MMGESIDFCNNDKKCVEIDVVDRGKRNEVPILTKFDFKKIRRIHTTMAF